MGEKPSPLGKNFSLIFAQQRIQGVEGSSKDKKSFPRILKLSALSDGSYLINLI
jgi:hypothetical protein